ncbi:hypothetical protein E3V39_12245 [Gammaproteobacteria bacterium LSUCC0112]|nr:hypothetical protein E3V39_12245 [Gammaproteobacteria bacterium LSUCC0112]
MAEVIGFYREKVHAGMIRCPDKYYVLTSTESELRQRKASDQRRSRRNFEKHLRLIQPHKQLIQTTSLLAGENQRKPVS